MEVARQLRGHVTVLVPHMQCTVDPSTARTLVGNRTHPNLELAAAGLGLHRGLYQNASQAMREMNKAYPGSITESTMKNPKKAKEWRDSLARYEELQQEKRQREEQQLHEAAALAALLNPSTQTMEDVDMSEAAVSPVLSPELTTLQLALTEEPLETEEEMAMLRAENRQRQLAMQRARTAKYRSRTAVARYKAWDELTVPQRAAAACFGFTEKYMWGDRFHGILTQDDSRPRRERWSLMPSGRAWFRSWHRLTEEKKKAAETLGYNQTSWRAERYQSGFEQRAREGNAAEFMFIRPFDSPLGKIRAFGNCQDHMSMPGRESGSNVAIALVDEGAFGLKTESVEELEHFEDLLVGYTDDSDTEKSSLDSWEYELDGSELSWCSLQDFGEPPESKAIKSLESYKSGTNCSWNHLSPTPRKAFVPYDCMDLLGTPVPNPFSRHSKRRALRGANDLLISSTYPLSAHKYAWGVIQRYRPRIAGV